MGVMTVTPAAVPGVGPGKFGLTQTRKVYRPGGSSGFANGTFSLLTAAEAPYVAAALLYVNGTNASYQIDKAAVAPTSAVGDGYTPSGGNSVFSSYAITFSGSATGTVPAATASGATGTPGILVSDWTSVESLARSDGGTLPLILARTYGAAAPSVSSPTSTDASNWASVCEGRIMVGYRKSGDCVTTPGNFTTPTASSDFVQPQGVLFRSGVGGISILNVGDSTMQGQGSTSNFNGALARTCVTLSTTSYAVMCTNVGYAGQTNPVFIANAQLYIAALKPDVVLIQPWSVNDSPSSQLTAIQAFSRSMALAEYAVGQGAVPVFVTAIPANLTNPADTYRKLVNSYVRGQGRYLYADFDAVLSDNASPAKILPAYDSGDGLHPNDAGYAAESAVLTPVIGRIMAVRPR